MPVSKETVPVVDISYARSGDPFERAAIARLVDDAFSRIGFMTIIGHGVPAAVVEDARKTAREFFALPAERKLAASKKDQTLNRGYIPFATEAVGRSYGLDDDAPPDLKEAFVVGRLDEPPSGSVVSEAHIQFAPNLWPEEPTGFREAISRYYVELESLAFHLMRIFAIALRLPEDFLKPFFSAHNAVMRLQNYPAQKAPPLLGQLRIAAHTDYGAFTILKGDDRARGLQVLSRQGRWIDIEPCTDSFVINIGDLMMTWTNDRWQSNVHRVVNPSGDGDNNFDRLTIPYFVNPNYDALIECLPTCADPGVLPRYGAMLAGEHRMRKLRKTA